MEDIAIKVKPKRLSRKIILTDEHFSAAVTTDQRRLLLTSDMALTAQRLIMAQERDSKLIVGGVTEVLDATYVDLTTPENVPVIRLTRSLGKFEVHCRTKRIYEKNRSGDYVFSSDSPVKFKYYSRLALASKRTPDIDDVVKAMWGRLYYAADINKKVKATVSLPPEVLLYLSNIRNNPNDAVDAFMEDKINKHVTEARVTHEDAMNTIGNVKDFLHNPVWYVEPYPDVGVAVCQASYAGTTLASQDNASVQITKPMVYASSLDTLPDDYRIPVMVRLKMLKAHVENTDENRHQKIYDMIPMQDKFYDDVGVFTYSVSSHSYRTPCAVLFA